MRPPKVLATFVVGKAIAQDATNAARGATAVLSSAAVLDPGVAVDGDYSTDDVTLCAQTLPEEEPWLRVDLPEPATIRQIGLWGRSGVSEGDPTFNTPVEVWVGSSAWSEANAVSRDDLIAAGATPCTGGAQTVPLLNQAVDEDGASAAIADCGASGATGSWVLVIARGTADVPLRTLAICELGIEPKWFADRLDLAGAAARTQSFDNDEEYACENQKPLCKVALRALPDGVATPFDEVAILPPGSSCAAGFSSDSVPLAPGFGANPLPGADPATGEPRLFENVTYDAAAGVMELPVIVGRPMTKDVETHVLCACLRPVERFKPVLSRPCKPEEFTAPVGSLRIQGSAYSWSFATAASVAVVLFYVGL
jgi:hypothetical protein